MREPGTKVTGKLALEDFAVEPVELNGRYVVEQRPDGVAAHGTYPIHLVVPHADERLKRSRSAVAQCPQPYAYLWCFTGYGCKNQLAARCVMVAVHGGPSTPVILSRSRGRARTLGSGSTPRQRLERLQLCGGNPLPLLVAPPRHGHSARRAPERPRPSVEPRYASSRLPVAF